MGTQGTGRKRSTKKERSTAEDDALNLIAREAEARLAAKRAARAEAREIRMKELERQQKEIFQVQKKYYGLNTKLDDPVDSKWGDIEQWMEDSERYSRSSRIQTLSDDDEQMSVGSRGSVRVEDRDYLEKGSRAASALTAGTLTSLGGTSSRRGSGETAITIDAETSIREIKEIHELKDQIQDVEAKYTQNLKEVKDVLAEVEEKYRKAMVSNAQLDNEKNNLMYQVDTLKDSLMELEELLSESRRGYEEKVKEYEREKYAHSVLQFQFNEMKETLKQSEELLNEIRQLRLKQEGFVREISDLQETVEWKDKKIGALERQKEYTDAIRIERDELREEVVNLKDILKKHGIVLGPDLNINGDGGEAEVDGSPSADPASQPAQGSQTSPTEGNSMLGNTKETQLRSSEEEEVDQEQHQEMFEEAKENHLSNDTLWNVAAVSTLETTSEEQPTEEQQKCSATEEDKVEESGLSNDLNVDTDDCSITEAKDIIVCSRGLQEIVTNSEENVPQTETPEGGHLVETSNPDVGETETKSSSVRESCNNLCEEQENKEEEFEESYFRNTESCPQQKVAQDFVKESLPDEFVPVVSNTEPQQKPENANDAENDEAEEISSKSQPQDATVSGKKKKKKRRGKKKGATHEDKNQQKVGTDKEKSKTEKDIESAARDNKPTTEPDIDGSVTETLKKSRVDQVKNEQDMQETEEVDGLEVVKPTENVSHNETLKESQMDHVTDEHDKEQTLKTENIEEVEAVATTETFSHIETPKKIRVDLVTDEQNKEQSLEATAPTEIFSHIESLEESSTDPKKHEQDKEQTLEARKAEEVGPLTSPVPETNLSTSDLIDNSKAAESTDGLDKVCTSSVDNAKSGADISTNGNVIHTESELVDSAEGEVGSVDERKCEMTTNNPENTFETNGKENAESHVSSHGDIVADESESANNSESKDNTSVSLCSTDGFTDGLKNLSSSEPHSELPSELTAVVKLGSDDTEEATETVKDDEEPGAETEEEYFSASVISPTHDGDNSGPKPDRTEKEELNRDLREPEGLVEPDSPSLDEKSDSCGSASLTKNTDAFDTENNLLETVAQAEQLDNVESQILQCEDQIDESKSEVSSETEETNTINMLITPHSPKESTEIGSSIEQDNSTEESAVAEDLEQRTSQNDHQSETRLCHLADQLHEPSKDKSEDNDSSRPTLQDSDEEDGEDEEGKSFDFDDLDIEVAVATNLPQNLKQEEVEEGVEVMTDESNNGSSGLYQSNTESNENKQDEPVESNDEKCTVDGNQVDTLDKESDTMPQDNQNSLGQEEAMSENVWEKQKNMPEEEVGVADEPRNITEEGNVLNVGELGVVAEKINQAVPLPVEEGLDAIKHELQGEDLVSVKSADQVASNKESLQTGKDVKKNSKKGKGKAKEECKMS